MYFRSSSFLYKHQVISGCVLIRLGVAHNQYKGNKQGDIKHLKSRSQTLYALFTKNIVYYLKIILMYLFNHPVWFFCLYISTLTHMDYLSILCGKHYWMEDKGLVPLLVKCNVKLWFKTNALKTTLQSE